LILNTLDSKEFANELFLREGIELRSCDVIVQQLRAQLFQLCGAESTHELIDMMLLGLKEFDSFELTTRTKGQSESFKPTFDLDESESNARPLGMRTCSKSKTHMFTSTDCVHVPSFLIYSIFIEETICNVGAEDYVLSSPSASGIAVHLPSSGVGHLLMALLRGVEIEEAKNVIPTAVPSQHHSTSLMNVNRRGQSSGKRQYSTTTLGRKR